MIKEKKIVYSYDVFYSVKGLDGTLTDTVQGADRQEAIENFKGLHEGEDFKILHTQKLSSQPLYRPNNRTMTNTIQTENALLVTVPEGTCNATIWQDKAIAFYDFYYEHISNIPLPPGEYEILGLADQLTEEQAAQIVERGESTTTTFTKPENLEGWEEGMSSSKNKTWTKVDRVFYKNYAVKQPRRSFAWSDSVATACKSVQSLCALHNLTASTTLVLKRK